MAIVTLAVVSTGLLGVAGCATTREPEPTIRLIGAIDVVAGARFPRDTLVRARLVRGAEVLDEMTIRPDRPTPWGFTLLYDREQAGGSARIEVQGRSGGQVVLAATGPLEVPLDGRGRTVAVRLEPPRQAVGP